MKDVTAYVRAHAIPQLPPPDPGRWVPKPGWTPQRFGEHVLVFDTETTLDPSQRCLVGAYRIYTWTGEGYVLVEQGLVRGDGLGRTEQRRLTRYAETHDLPVLARAEFCKLLIREGCDLGTLIVGFNLPFDLGGLALRWGKGRKRWQRGFRLPLLPTIYEPRLRMRKIGPTSTLIEWSTYGDNKKPNPRERGGRKPFAGRFLDLQSACGALWWGKKLSLARACRNVGIALPKIPVETFGIITPALIDHCRRDVELTWQVFLAVREEANRHPSLTPIPSPPLPRGAKVEDTTDLSKDAHLVTRLHSPAALGKAYLDAMGVRPRLELQPDFPRDILGHAMVAFYGGRTETRYPETILPVVSLDILRTYVSVNVLMGLWEWDVAERIEVEDATDDAREFFSTLTFESLFRPEVWKRFHVLCLVEPDGDRLPIRLRGQPGDAPTMHLKNVSGSALAYTLPDLIASWLETGRAPHIIQAWRFVPRGQQPGLRPVQFRGEVLLDPSQDVFAALREAGLDLRDRLQGAKQARRREEALDFTRRDVSVKLIGEADSYGIFVEVNEEDQGAETAGVWGLEHFTARISREEYTGRFYFPPRGALVTASARLLLAMMERQVRDAGSAWATMDTDSITIISTESGGLVPCPGGRERLPDGREAVRALPRAEVERFVDRFTPLSLLPGRSLWKWENENMPHPNARRDPQLYLLAAGLKKYALFNIADDGRVILRKRTETALGHLVPPSGHTKTQMIDALWEAKIRKARGEKDAFSTPPFAHAPALGRLPITTPDLLRRLRVTPRGIGKMQKHQRAAPRPFGFFYTAMPRGGIPVFGGDVYWHGWCRLDHRESVGCPHPQRDCPYRAGCALAHPVRPITFDDPMREDWYRAHWMDHYTGRPLQMVGMSVEMDQPPRISARSFANLAELILTYEPRVGLDDNEVRVARFVHTGKEARHLEEVGAALLIPEETVLVYQPDDGGDDLLRQTLREIPVPWLADDSGLSRRMIQRCRNGHTRVYPANRKRLWLAVARWQQLHIHEASS